MVKLNFIFLGALLAAAALPLAAQNNAGEAYGGYVYAKANPESTLPKEGMNGWVGSAAGYPGRWFGVGFEISGMFGDIPAPSGVSAPSLHAKEYSYLAGPQFRFIDKSRIQTAFKINVGGVFGQVNVDSHASSTQINNLGAAGYQGFNQTKFAALFALPVDVSVTKTVAIRVEPGLYLTNFNQSGQGNFRISVGPVFRFGYRQ